MRESISFAKLNNGKWGVRVASHNQPSIGDEVMVRTAKGETKRIKLGGIVSTDRGAFPAPAVYYAIAHDPGHKRRAANGGMWSASSRGVSERTSREREALRQSLIEQGRAARVELDNAEAAWEHYDPADHEWFDGETEIQAAYEASLRARIDRASETYIALREAYRIGFIAKSGRRAA